MTTVNFESILIKIAEYQLNNLVNINSHNYFYPGGCNGPYFDIETPVRNTSHWLCTCALLYSKTKDQRFIDAGHRLANFLITTSYNINGIFVHRQKAGKDIVNGVIGQAWVIESLAAAGRCFQEQEYIDKAQFFASKYPYSDNARAWASKDPFTGKTKVDYTLNHQLWFAAAYTEAMNAPSENVTHFLDSLAKGAFSVDHKGLIKHILIANDLKGLAIRLRYNLSKIRNAWPTEEKEIGYHLFNLHPIARLKHYYPDHSFFKTTNLGKAIELSFSKDFMENLNGNKYSYPYNSPAYEIKRVGSLRQDPTNNYLFEEDTQKRHISLTYSELDKSFNNDTPDSLTLTSRMYEYFI